jgi:hypothetical protein
VTHNLAVNWFVKALQLSFDKYFNNRNSLDKLCFSGRIWTQFLNQTTPTENLLSTKPVEPGMEQLAARLPMNMSFKSIDRLWIARQQTGMQTGMQTEVA